MGSIIVNLLEILYLDKVLFLPLIHVPLSFYQFSMVFDILVL